MSAISPAHYAAALARATELLRAGAEGGDAQKNALEDLVEIAERTSVTFRLYEGVLTADGAALDLSLPAFAALGTRFESHAVRELIIARGADAGELLALCRGLAAESGQGRIKERLRDAGSGRVMLVIEQPGDFQSQRRKPSVSQAFAKAALDEAAMQEWNSFLQQGADKSRDRVVKIDLPAENPDHAGRAGITPAPGTEGTQGTHGTEGGGTDGREGAEAAAPRQPRTTGYQPPVDPPRAPAAPAGHHLPQPPTLAAASPLATALAAVLQRPYEGDVLQRLTKLGRFLDEALTQDRVAEVIDVLNTIIDVESKAPNDQARSPYHVVMGRALTRPVLAQIVPYVLEQRRAARATIVLRRGGELTIELLMGLLQSSQSLGDRLAYLRVMRGMPGAKERAVALLSRAGRHEWQTVRNLTEALGEARIEEAIPYIARLTQHEDQRVRRTAIVALCRIASPRTMDGIKALLQEKAPEIRSLTAASIGGAHANALVPVLGDAADAEKNADVARELCKAIARIGTPEAAQELSELTEPGGGFLSRRPGYLREAAKAALASIRPAGAGPGTAAPR